MAESANYFASDRRNEVEPDPRPVSVLTDRFAKAVIAITAIATFVSGLTGFRLTGFRDDIASNQHNISVLFGLDSARGRQIDSLTDNSEAVLYMSCISFAERHIEQVPARCDKALRRVR